MKNHLIAFAAIALMASCNNGTSTRQQNTSAETTETAPAKERKTIRKQLFTTSSFTNIINVGSIDIIYTMGENRLEAEGESALIEHIEADFDSNLLTVGLAGDSNTDINQFGKTNNVKLYVSCPSLQCVSICGNGGFKQEGKWTSPEEIQVGVLGTGSIILGDIEAPSFRLEATDVGPVTIAHLKSDYAIFNCRAVTSITADLDVHDLSVFNGCSPQFTITGHADKSYFESPKDENLKNMLK